jgi:hypothetical protein
MAQMEVRFMMYFDVLYVAIFDLMQIFMGKCILTRFSY